MPLATNAVRRSDRDGRTPVLVVDQRILSEGIIGALAADLHKAAERDVRIEVLLVTDGVLAFMRAARTRRVVARLGRGIPAELRSAVTVERRSVLSRPGGPLRPLVVGIAAVGDPLPSWAARMPLTLRPTHVDDFHLIPAA